MCYGRQSVPTNHQTAPPPDEVQDQDHNDDVDHDDDNVIYDISIIYF